MSKGVQVKLSTPSGVVFDGEASGVEIKTAESVIQINRPRHGYISLNQASELAMRVDSRWLVFHLSNASAGVGEDGLTILAERIEKGEVPEQNPS